MIQEGVERLGQALQQRDAGPYQIQAAIAACHAIAHTAAETDWAEISALYAKLEAISPSPIVTLNRAVAVTEVAGPAAALDILNTLEAAGQLANYHLLPAIQADCLRRLNRYAEAARYYRKALHAVKTAVKIELETHASGAHWARASRLLTRGGSVFMIMGAVKACHLFCK
jgi:RNA polymerase sigma-70 factor, ECF subfamily